MKHFSFFFFACFSLAHWEFGNVFSFICLSDSFLFYFMSYFNNHSLPILLHFIPTF